MGKFRRIAENLAKSIHEIGKERAIHSKEIPDILQEIFGQGSLGINCYPGQPDGVCCEMAWFISLTVSSHVRRGSGHLNFKEAMAKFIQHMQGPCCKITKTVIFFTDNWDPNIFNDWKYNIDNIKKDAHVEFYLMVGPNVSELFF
ncbi:MAG: hypothetical protein WCJ37_17525 [Syntrophus sp. (in: bacteria)]